MALAGITVDRCDRCAGIWFDNGELESLPAELSDVELAKEAALAFESLRIPSTAVWTQVRYFDCPVCRTSMNRRNYQNVSGIILNRCQEHGTWLDDKNTSALLRLLAEGRLPEVRARAQTVLSDKFRHQTTDLEEEKLRLQWQADQLREMSTPRTSLARMMLWSLLDFFF